MIAISVNGKTHEVDVDPAAPLLYVLRNDLALNGAKYGCGLGQCGSCTVLLNDRAVFSCLLPVGAIGEGKVTTLEGLAEASGPGAVQKAFIEEQSAQCGYCIPGMIMRAQALLLQNPSPSDTEIRAHMTTNLCRCGTHMRILAAVKRATKRS